MTHNEFIQQVKDFNNLLKNESDELERYERNDELLSERFLLKYERLLHDRLRYCLMCGDYYRSMAEHSFWFMRPFVRRRARQFEAFHYETMGRLIELRTLRFSMYHGKERAGYSD